LVFFFLFSSFFHCTSFFDPLFVQPKGDPVAEGKLKDEIAAQRALIDQLTAQNQELLAKMGSLEGALEQEKNAAVCDNLALLFFQD
jgi:hypothetical protein